MESLESLYGDVSGSCNSFAKDDDHGGSSSDVQQPRFRSYVCNRFSCNSKLSHALKTSTMALVMAVCLLLPLACYADAIPEVVNNPSDHEENNDIIANLDEKSVTSEPPSFLESSLGGGLEENIRSEVKNEIKTVQSASPAILNALDVLPDNEKILLIEHPKATLAVSEEESSKLQGNESQTDIEPLLETQCDALVCKWNKNQIPSTTTATPALDLPAETTVLQAVTESTPAPETININANQQQSIEDNMREPRIFESNNLAQRQEVNAEITTPVPVETEALNNQAEIIASNSEQEAVAKEVAKNNESLAQTSAIEMNSQNNVPELVPSLNVVDVVKQQSYEEPIVAEVSSSLPAQEDSVASVAIDETSIQTKIEENLPVDLPNSLVANEIDKILSQTSNNANETNNDLAKSLLPPNPSSNSNNFNSESKVSIDNIDNENQIIAIKPNDSLQESLLTSNPSSNSNQLNTDSEVSNDKIDNEDPITVIKPIDSLKESLLPPNPSSNSNQLNTDSEVSNDKIDNENQIIGIKPIDSLKESLLPPNPLSNSNQLNTDSEVSNDKIDNENQITGIKSSDSLQEVLTSSESSKTDSRSIESLENDIAKLPSPNNSNDSSESVESNEELSPTITPVSVELAQNSNLPVDNDTLSIVFEEPLSATEPPVLLEDVGIKNLIDLEGTNFNEAEAAHTTLAPEEAMHNVIKKQGVESIDLEIDAIKEKTTILPATVLSIDEPIEQPIVLTEAHNVEANPLNAIEISPSTSQPAILNTNEQSTLSTIKTSIANDITEVSVVFPGKSDEDATTTSKGSRSVNALLGNGNQKASMNFDIYPAGQTLNGNLAEELPNGIGKALPTHRLNEETSNRSTLIIGLCSGTAVLFIVVSVGIFLISFQRQHGTLDIEMQEQRCGKDNINDEETCVKLLDVDLPNSGLANQTDAEAEIEECL